MCRKTDEIEFTEVCEGAKDTYGDERDPIYSFIM